MKLKKAIITGATAIIASAVMCTAAFAKEHNDVNTGAQIIDIFSTDTDPEIIINLSGDIESLEEIISSKGHIYTINGKEYKIKSAVKVSGNGTLNINSDIDAKGDALSVSDSASVTVDGNVKGDTGITSSGSAKVTVTGDVSANSKEEDVTKPTSSYEEGGYGVNASGNSEVTVNGNVSGGDIESKGTHTIVGGTGVIAEDESTVKVKGSVTGGSVNGGSAAENEQHNDGGDGVAVYGEATVEVGEDVTGGDTDGNNGNAGSGVLITIVPVESEGNGRTTEGMTYGKVRVDGTISGGKSTGENGKSGAGIVYWYMDVDQYKEDLLVLPEDGIPDYISASNIVRMTEAYATEGFGNYVLGELGFSEKEIDSIMNNYSKGLNTLLAKAIDQEDFDINKAEDVAKLNALDADIKLNIIKYYNNFFRDYTEEFLQNKINKQIGDNSIVTTHEVKSGGDDVSAVISSVGEITAQILNNKHNYIVYVASSENGTISLNKESCTYNPGETVTITATPNDGYEVGSIMLNGEAITSVDGVYSFEMPQYGGAEVSAEFVVADDDSKKDEEETEPTTTTEETTSASEEGKSNNSTSPDTGVTTSGFFWSVLTLIASGGVVTGLVAFLKKRKDNR